MLSLALRCRAAGLPAARAIGCISASAAFTSRAPPAEHVNRRRLWSPHAPLYAPLLARDEAMQRYGRVYSPAAALAWPASPRRVGAAPRFLAGTRGMAGSARGKGGGSGGQSGLVSRLDRIARLLKSPSIEFRAVGAGGPNVKPGSERVKVQARYPLDAAVAEGAVSQIAADWLRQRGPDNARSIGARLSQNLFIVTCQTHKSSQLNRAECYTRLEEAFAKAELAAKGDAGGDLARRRKLYARPDHKAAVRRKSSSEDEDEEQPEQPPAVEPWQTEWRSLLDAFGPQIETELFQLGVAKRNRRLRILRAALYGLPPQARHTGEAMLEEVMALLEQAGGPDPDLIENPAARALARVLTERKRIEHLERARKTLRALHQEERRLK